MLRVYLTDSDLASHDIERDVLERAGVRFEVLRARGPDDLIARAREADGLLVQYMQITKPIIDALPRLRVIGRYGIGFDTIDVAAASARGVYVCNCPDYCIDEVADHTVALLLALTRRLFPLRHHVAAGNWSIDPAKPAPRLRGRALGIVGVGRIGRAVAERTRPLGLRLIGHDPFISDDRLSGFGVDPMPLDDLLRQADYVTLHVPFSGETRHLLNRERLVLMKPGAVLINTARGGLVDTEALLEALRSSHLGAAGLDVLEQEPPASDHPFRSMSNVILTPHTALYSEESLSTLKREVTEDVAGILRGEAPKNAVNREAVLRFRTP